MECRSTERRQWIVNNYNVVPIAHVQLLAGQYKYSDAGARIKNDYYIFYVNDRGDNNRRGIIQCGMGAARDFLRLIGHEGLPLFNPLYGETVVGNHNEENDGENGGRIPQAQDWNPVAQQLFNAIMWVIIIIDAKPDTPIFDIKEKVYSMRGREPFHKYVKAVNTIIGKSLGGRTLTQAIDELRVQNRFRDNMCQFDRLVEIISNYTDKDGNKQKLDVFF